MERSRADDEDMDVSRGLGGSISDIELRERSADFPGRMGEDERFREPVEERVKKCIALNEGKKRKAGLEAEESRLNKGVFLEGSKLRKEELTARLVSVYEWMQATRAEVLSIRKRSFQKFKKIESEERSIRSARESLAEEKRKIDVIIGNLDARINAVEEREKQFSVFLEGKTREMVLKEETLSRKCEEFVREVKLAGDSCREQEKLRRGCVQRLKLAENRLEDLRAMIVEKVTVMEHREFVARESVEGAIKEADIIRESMEKQLVEFDMMRKEFNSLQGSKVQELVLNVDGKLRDNPLVHKEKFDHLPLERLKSTQKKLGELKHLVDERFKEVALKEFQVNSLSDWVERKMDELDSKEKELEEREKRVMIMEEDMISRGDDLQKKKSELDLKETNQEVSAEREREVDAVARTLDERIHKIEEREKQFHVFSEERMRELVLKEENLIMQREEFVREVKLADEKCREQEKLRHGCIERLELSENRLEGVRAMIVERFTEIEHRECVAWEGAVKEADIIRESVEKQLDEFDKMRREFNSFQDDKMRELVSKEEQLDAMCKQLYDTAKLRTEILVQKEKLGHELLERLELMQKNVEELRKSVHERFKEIGMKEHQLNALSDWVEGKIDELDSKAKELEEKEKRVTIMEDDMTYWESNLQMKKSDLDLMEMSLVNWEKELEDKQREVLLGEELNEKRMEELDWREKNLNSVREFTRNCFKEHRGIKKQLQLERDAVQRHDAELRHKERQLNEFVREFEFKEKQYKDQINELELKQQHLTDVLNTHAKMESDESVAIKFIVRMDGKHLQMYLNDPEKDLGSMGDEIFKVLHLSSDPAKLVLDAMVGFYPPHLRKDDVQCKVQKTCILLLEQLSKMSLKIQPGVREAAVELTTEWRSKMRVCMENHLEVLGFLHLLVAYGLQPYFDKDEILELLTVVGKQGQTHKFHVLGFSEKTADVI